MTRVMARIRRGLATLRYDRRGNVLVMTAFAMLMLTFALGMGMDYSRAEALQTKLSAAADAASLAAVDAAMIQQSDAAAMTAATNMFNAQVSGLNGLVYNSATDLHITIATSGVLSVGRTVTVAFSAKSTNLFSAFLHRATLPISGSVTANASQAPNINFYLVLDTSPSMLLPSTSDGLTKIRTATGCAFACHNQNPHSDSIYVRDTAGHDIFLDSAGNWHPVGSVNGGNGKVYDTGGHQVGVTSPGTPVGQYADGMWLTQNYGALYGSPASLDLRVDDETAAATALIPYAQDWASRNRVTYQMQMFSFGYGSPSALNASMTNVTNLSASSVPNLMSLQPNWYRNNCLTSSLCINDEATDFTTMLSAMNTAMPTPGTGSATGTPQEVMFIVTDGMDDELLAGSRNNRELQAAHIAQCQAIKNRGIKIAILYTVYLPEALTGDSWSQSNVAPYLGNVLPALQQCASTSSGGAPLVYAVTTDQDVSAALQGLFALAMQNAHLVR